ncbi:MAG: extensin family protein, partial [Alphaproteobacteria bacterium]
MELLNLRYPDQKPTNQAQKTTRKTATNKDLPAKQPTRKVVVTAQNQALTPEKQSVTRIIPQSKPWVSEASDVPDAPEKIQEEAKPIPSKPVATLKIRPSNHMLGLTVVKQKKQDAAKAEAKKAKSKKKKTKSKKKKSKGRRAPPTQHANQSSYACQQALSRFDVAYTPISDISTGSGCELRNGVSVSRIQGVEIRPAAKLNCDMVVRTADFINRAQDAASTYMGARIESLHHMS